MNINRNNYEAYFIDFYDGKLTDLLELELKLFLDENPDLRADFDAFEDIPVEISRIDFPQKHKLKKPEIVQVSGIHEGNYEETFAAFYENDLDDREKIVLRSFLETNQHLNTEFQLYASIKLQGDHIVYEHKDQLKKKAFIAYYWYAAAAIVLIFLSIGVLMNLNKPIESQIRFKIAPMASLNSINDIKSNTSNSLILNNRERFRVSLPVPESDEWEEIHLLASIQPSDNVLSLNLDVNIIEPVGYKEIVLLVDTEEPKKRGLLAQIFRKNIEDMSEDLGLDNSLDSKSEAKKKDPGFVKFLNGSLTVFNTITGSDTELVKNYDNEGNLRNYSLEGQTLVVNRKLPVGSSSN